jgi:hypothetical protein
MRHDINGLTVDLKTGVVLTNSDRLIIRSKTLQVMVKLIELRDRIVTKQELLDDIWHDVVVQEQVLAQSVKELRDIFGSDIIKTFPRSGYQWVASLTSHCDQNRFAVFKKPFFQIGMIVVMLLLAVVFFSRISSSSNLTIALLPVDNAMQDKEHNWVAVKGLEYLNQRLVKMSELDVVDSGHVLYALERLDINTRRTFSSHNIYPLMAKLEADLLIKTRLTGFPLDYQLHYFIYTDKNVERGIINAKKVNFAFDQLIELVAKRFGTYQPSNFQFQENAFSNEAFARGVELYLNNDFEQATALFSSALQSNNELLAARRYLAASYANTERQDEAIALLKQNIKLAGKAENRELIRAHLMIGYLKINWPQSDDRAGELQQASDHIAIAQQLAEQQQDKLFIAYAYEELGKIKRLQGQYVQAIRLLTQALSYHQEFDSVYGQTAALIELAKVAAEQSELAESKRYLSQALDIAERSNAQANLVWVYLAKADIARSQLDKEQAERHAMQAKKIAQQNDNSLLMNRVQAWFNHASVYSVN